MDPQDTDPTAQIQSPKAVRLANLGRQQSDQRSGSKHRRGMPRSNLHRLFRDRRPQALLLPSTKRTAAPPRTLGGARRRGCNRPFPSAIYKLDRDTRREGRGESIGWVSYRRNDAQEHGHGATRICGCPRSTVSDSSLTGRQSHAWLSRTYST